MADTMTARVTAADIRAALALRYPSKSHSLMFEVAPETGSATRYADAVAVGLWRSHGHKIEGFEIKVSRSDFLSEMAKPEKSAPVFQYCNHWWLVTPKGLVEPSELPTTWGLMELCGDMLRVKVKAPALKPVPPTIGFFASLCRRGGQNVNDLVEKLLNKERDALTTAIRGKIRAEFEGARSRQQKAIEAGMKTLEDIKVATGIDLAAPEWTRPDWLAAVKFVAEVGVGRAYGALADVLSGCKRLCKKIEDAGLVQDEREDHADAR
jgi:hypothetical protein